MITGKTKLLGIIGSPVEHSLSPLMQNAALEELGLDYVYVPFPVREEELAAAVKGLKSLGVAGFNVTIPHKTAVVPFLDRISPEALLIGAVNTVKREGEELVGYNTDGAGFVRSLREDLGFDPRGAAILVLGAGGAARGGVVALSQAGAASITVANRNPDRGMELVESLRGHFAGTKFAAISLDMHEINAGLQNIDILVNTTSVGMWGSSFTGLDLSLMRPGACLYDMVYAPFETPLLADARKAGLKCANGIGMLAAQGELGFAIWTGTEPPSGVMKRQLLSVVGR